MSRPGAHWLIVERLADRDRLDLCDNGRSMETGNWAWERSQEAWKGPRDEKKKRHHGGGMLCLEFDRCLRGRSKPVAKRTHSGPVMSQQ